LAHIRDYSKAPFMLALVIVMALMVRGPMQPRRVLILAAGFGLLAGIGFGFRNDLLVSMPAFAAVVFFFLPGGVTRDLKLKVAALAVAAVAFVGSMSPMLGPYAEGGGLQVVALLGFVSPFDETLQVKRGPYEFGYRYSDWLMGAIIRDYSRRRHHVNEPIPLYRGTYNTAGTALLFDMLRHTPADILARAYASVLTVARLPVSNWTDSHWPPLPPQDRWMSFFEARARWLTYAQWLWPAAVVAALVVGAAFNLRAAVFTVFVLVYFAGYPAIQFHERHYFFLNFVPLIALAFLLSRLAALARWQGDARQSPRALGAGATRAAAFGAALAVALVAPMAVLRAYQQAHVRSELDERLRAPRQPVSTLPEQAGEANVRYVTATLPAEQQARAHPGVVTSEYLVARFGGERCDAVRLPVTLRYQSPYPRGDFSRDLTLELPARGDLDLLTPVFYRVRPESDATDFTDRFSDYQFRGFELDARDAACLQQVDRITDTTPFSVLWAATLGPDWHEHALYQRLAAIENVGEDKMQTFAMPQDLRITRGVLGSALEPLAITAKSNALQPTPDGGWTMNSGEGLGGATAPFAYLMTAAPKATPGGALLVVEGVLRHGGLTVGLLRDNQWLIQTPVTGAGPFLAVVQVPSAGESTVVLANNIPEGPIRNDFDIRRAGWLEPAATR
jgi:hypothetical protein